MNVLRRWWWLILMLMVAVATSFYCAFQWGFLRFNYPDQAVYPVQGLDVSHHQGEIDWQAINAQADQPKYRFVFIKATEGGDFKDPRFVRNWESAKNAGFKVGAYHFYRNCKSGREQAQNFIDSVPKQTDSLPPVIDLEFMGNCENDLTTAQLQAEIRSMAVALEQHYQQKPIFYVTQDYYAMYLQQGFEEYPLWYRDIFQRPKIAAGRPWLFWQYSHRGRVNGIDGVVDLNTFNGSVADFEARF
ncbi:lysozyme [Acinetobacter marinus]|uniref:Lysozyme n=1 Tax=Acinetobacter marinus TaxID=281375 RepID=A0A1G6KND7_9GAMM|nr:GH25 family lysozyme [Acinetobacter marinus]SDC31846.1 lysozyme [Acinetobacter marinus]